jgi:hypothetical protein
MSKRPFFRSVTITASLVAALSAYGVARADLIMPYGSGTTTYSVMNVGTGSATVVATYYDPNGTIPSGSGSTHTLPQNGRLDITAGQTPDGPLPTNWSGSVVLSSDQDIIAAAQTKYTGRLAAETDSLQTLGTEASAYEAFNAGSTDIYFPVLVRVKQASNPTVAQLSTRYTVQNTSGSPATVYLNYRNFDGTVYAPTIITLQPYGSRTFNTVVDADLPTGMNTAPASIAFSARVTATQPIVGVAEQSWNFDGFIGSVPTKQNWAADYTAIPFSEATTTLFGPLVARVGAPIASSRPCTFANYSTFVFYTQFAVQNTTATTATVTATFIRSNNTGTGVNAPSGLATYSITYQIGPFGTWNLNMFAGALGFDQSNGPFWSAFANGYNPGTGAATHCNWNGSVKFTSDQPIVGFSFIQQPASFQNYASAFNFFGASGATDTALLPRMDRVCTGTCNAAQAELFPAFSSLTVQNVGNSSTNLTVTFYKPDGTVAQTFTLDGNSNPITLAPGAQYSFNTRAGANASIAQTQSLGPMFKGTVRVTASGGVPIRIFNNLLSGLDDADAFVGFNR